MDSVHHQLVLFTNSTGLRPTTPAYSTRYDKSTTVEPLHTVIPAGPMFPNQSLSLPVEWSAHTHPEGQLYFHRNSTLRVVTEAYIYRPEILDRILYWSKWIQELLHQRNINVSDDIELFLRLDHDLESCEYYLIDHDSRTEFWLEQYSTELLGMPPVVSPSHLKMALQQHYWIHVECFPAYAGNAVSQAVDELMSIFLHGRTDRMTSNVSTFPYTAERCASILESLRNCHNQPLDSYKSCVVARLWGTIAENRFLNHFGQETARLSSDQSILVKATPERRWIPSVFSVFFCGVPEVYSERLNNQFVDELIYVDRWGPFMTGCLDEWKLYISWAVPLLILNILMSFTSSASPIWAISACFICTLCILSAVILINRHEELVQATASAAASFVHSARSEKFGFQPVALIYSMPKIFFFWASGLFLTHGIFLSSHYLGIRAAIGLGAIIAVLVMAIRWTLSSDEIKESWIRFCNCFSWVRVYSRSLNKMHVEPV